MTHFRFGEPYQFPKGTHYGAAERLAEQFRGLYLRTLVYTLRGMRKLGLSSKSPAEPTEEA